MKATPNHAAASLVHLIHIYFIWAIVASYIAAALGPQFGLWIRASHLGDLVGMPDKLALNPPPVMLSMLLFNAGLGVSFKELRGARHKVFMMIAGLFGDVAAPLIMILFISLIMTLWHDSEEAQQLLAGLGLIAAMPIAGASTAWAQNANGSLVLSLGLVLLTTLLRPLTTPLTLHAVGFLTTGDYSEDLHELASGEAATFLGLWVILPSLVGLTTRSLIGEPRYLSLLPYVKLANFLVLVLLNYSNATLVLPKALSMPDPDFFLAIVVVVSVLYVVGFAGGYFLSRVLKANVPEAASLMSALGMNNNWTGLVLASMPLVDHPDVRFPMQNDLKQSLSWRRWAAFDDLRRIRCDKFTGRSTGLLGHNRHGCGRFRRPC